MKDDAFKGRIFEVDLDYPDHLHFRHSDYPLCPEKLRVKHDQFSPYQNKLLESLDMTYNEKQTKLVPHLGNRVNYITHYRNLKFYLRQGMILKTVHRVSEFNQASWVKEHVNFCTMMRQKAESNFEKDYWKFLVNSIFGKPIQRVRDQMDVQIAQNETKVLEYTSNHRMKSFKLLEDCQNIAIITLNRHKVELDKPIYTGFSVLELTIQPCQWGSWYWKSGGHITLRNR